MTQLSVFIASSLDGYIAGEDGSLAWLDSAASTDEDYGYDAFMSGVDALAMGRGTYDHIAHIEPLPFGPRPVFVFTHRAADDREGVTFWQRSAQEAVHEWEAAGLERVYVDGGLLIHQFLMAGLVDELTVTVAPLLLGSGKPLFHGGFPTTLLRLVDVERWPSGMAQLRYVRG